MPSPFKRLRFGHYRRIGPALIARLIVSKVLALFQKHASCTSQSMRPSHCWQLWITTSRWRKIWISFPYDFPCIIHLSYLLFDCADQNQRYCVNAAVFLYKVSMICIGWVTAWSINHPLHRSGHLMPFRNLSVSVSEDWLVTQLSPSEREPIDHLRSVQDMRIC